MEARSVELHPDLRRHIVSRASGRMLYHPLIIQSYGEQWNALYNRQLDDKRKTVQQAKAARDWGRIIWLHERPFRAIALQEIAALMPDDQYWRLVAEVWIDTENAFEMRAVWNRLWTAKRPHKGQVMTDSEHDALAILPEVTPGMVTIYRGCRDPKAVYGLNWTVSRNQALGFANRYANQHSPLLATAVVAKRNIQAFFLERIAGEATLVVLPRHCQSLTVEQVRQPVLV
jgi:hypothetical protein